MFSSFIDAIAGGGGLISIPAFIFFGLPIHQALGTNKFAASCSSFTSTWQYIRSKKINFSPLYKTIPFTVLGAVFGVNTALKLSAEFLKLIFGWLIIIITLYTLLSKDNRNKQLNHSTDQNKVTGWELYLFSLCMGFYDGFFGPGTGSFLIFGFRKLMKEDYLSASGHSKLLNFTSNVVSLCLYAFHGKVQYKVGIIVGFFMILGAYFGSKLAIRKGSLLIKPVFIMISASLGIKMLFDYFIR